MDLESLLKLASARASAWRELQDLAVEKGELLTRLAFVDSELRRVSGVLKVDEVSLESSSVDRNTDFTPQLSHDDVIVSIINGESGRVFNLSDLSLSSGLSKVRLNRVMRRLVQGKRVFKVGMNKYMSCSVDVLSLIRGSGSSGIDSRYLYSTLESGVLKSELRRLMSQGLIKSDGGRPNATYYAV